ncbi:type II toxin-antitoxin system RelE/ParE family toxin [Massilia sp. YIM B04103]|uniref:type II toxin-antitoxin system RelE/ParE family toxin n=1 Tax=Massilia sp. YIM B04103 TaxID=2963106 RepID=UPI00210B7FA3|nr:type II toxin-antitoxin system RelE/ParE family toxin [Massilia sp. YIM B04103]
MKLLWTSKASSDLGRLHEFLASINPSAAVRSVQAIVAAANRLPTHPHIGEELMGFQPREVRRLLVGQYEIRYEVKKSSVYLLRIWHTREKR